MVESKGLGAYVNIERMAFGPRGAYDFKFLIGDVSYVNYHNSGCLYKDESRVERIPDRALFELLNGPPLSVPIPCRDCPPQEQAFFWRSFTGSALEQFIKNKGVGKKLSPRGEGATLVAQSSPDEQGFLWGSNSVTDAVSVGLTRALTEKEQVYLLGFNICGCSLASGQELFQVHEYGNEVVPVGVADLRRPNIQYCAGTIVNFISPRQTQEGVVYVFDMSFFEDIQSAIFKKGKKLDPTRFYSKLQRLIDLLTRHKEQLVHDCSANKVSIMLHLILGAMANIDPEVKNRIPLQTLPRTWRPFLQREDNSLLRF